MNKVNIKSYITFLSRNKVYTAINVFGLSVSLMFVMLIGVYVWQEYSVDGVMPAGSGFVVGYDGVFDVWFGFGAVCRPGFSVFKVECA